MGRKNHQQPPKEVKPMEQKLQEYTVEINGAVHAVKVSEAGVEILRDGRERFSWESITNLARRNRLPQWCAQLAPVKAHIDEAFRKLQQRGESPHVAFHMWGDGKLYRHDLLSGQQIGAPITELKEKLASGQLPKAFSSPHARNLIAAA